MRQSCPPCQPVRDANLSCRYESFVTTVVILQIMCVCECCDGKVPRRMCWLQPDYSVAVLAKRRNHQVRNPCQRLMKTENPEESSILTWLSGITPCLKTRKVRWWTCVDEATKCSVGHVWAEGQQVGNIDGSRVLQLLQECWTSGFWTDAHTANRS